MQKIYRTIAILLLCGALCTPCVEARGRNNGHDRPEQHQTRPTPGRNDNKHGNRPGTGGHTSPRRVRSARRAIITDSLSGLRNPGITTSLSGLRRATTTALTDRSTGPSRGRPTTTIM